VTALVESTPGTLAALETARAYAGLAMSESTVRVYRIAWTHFADWCAGLGVSPLPADPAHVGGYIASIATTHSPNTIAQRLAAIGQMHRFHGLPWDQKAAPITTTRRGVLRKHGRAPKQAAAISLESLQALVATCDDSPAGVRDRALLLVGFAGAFRRSEIVALRVDDVAITKAGMRLAIRRSKTDQIGAGAEVGIPRGQFAETCPVRAVESWLSMLGDREREPGLPLFRRLSKAGRLVGYRAMSPCVVWDILEKRVAMAGLEEVMRPHGLRAGFITAAYDNGARDQDIMNHVRHKDLKTTRGYVRRAGLLTESPAGVIGL
jgi:site-specific recombinase XerD